MPFCPVDCIEQVPLAEAPTDQIIPPVRIRYDECIGCKICVRVCTKTTWDVIRMKPTEWIESEFSMEISEKFIPPPEDDD